MHAAVTPDTLGLIGAERSSPRMRDGRRLRQLRPGRAARPRRPHRRAAVAATSAGAGLDHFEGEQLADRPPARRHAQRRAHAPHRRRHLRHRGQPHHADGRRPRRACCAASAPPTSPTRRCSAMADTITSPTTTPEAVLAAAKKMLADGLVEGTSGNISGRLDGRPGVPHAVVGPLRHDDPRRPRGRRPRRQRRRGRPLPDHREGPPPVGAAGATRSSAR